MYYYNRERSPFSMVPVLDLVNHGNYAEAVNACHVFDCKDSSFQLIAERDISGGEEVLISYGSHRSTSSFVNIYGFAGRSSSSSSDSIYLNNPGDTIYISFPVASERVKCASSPLSFPASTSVDKVGGEDHRHLKVGVPLFDIIFGSDVQAAAEVEQLAVAMQANPLSIPEHVLSGLVAFLLSGTDCKDDNPRMRVAAVRLFVTIYCNSDAGEDATQKLLTGIQGAIDAICYAGDKMQHFGFQPGHSQGDGRVGNDFLQHLVAGMNTFRQDQSLVDGVKTSFSFDLHGSSGDSTNHEPSDGTRHPSLYQWQWNTCAPVVATELRFLLLLRDMTARLVHRK